MKLLCYKKNSGNNQDIQSSCHFERESDSFLMNYAILHNIDNINKQIIWSLELLKPDHVSYGFSILLPGFGTCRNPTRQSPKGVQAQEDASRAGFFQFLLDSKGRPQVGKCIMIFLKHLPYFRYFKPLNIQSLTHREFLIQKSFCYLSH